MSSEMSDDPEMETTNPFGKLSDDPILHILSFLPGDDLLELSQVDKNFKRIVTESTETMKKIQLVLDFEKHKDLDLDYAIKLAQTRRFTVLKLKSVHSLTDADAKVKLGILLQMLSSSVDDLEVWGEISQELLSSILAMFLPNLKKCELLVVRFNSDATPIIEEIGSRSNANHPLESLELMNFRIRLRSRASEFLQLFSGCNQLKTFCYHDPLGDIPEDIDHVNNFLATQHRLEKLDYFRHGGLAWDRLKCFQLKELKVRCLQDQDDQRAIAKFLKKLPSLTKLDLSVANQPSRRLMKEICGLPKLKKFSFQIWKDEDEDEDSLEGLVNHTVKQLHIDEYMGIASKLLKIFIGVASILLNVRTDVLDLSDVSPETIMKIKRDKGHWKYFAVKFSPSDLPTNVEQFESAMMKFAGNFSKFVTAIEIGHESWRTSGTIRLSNSFCEELVNRLPQLVKLEIYNIADRGRFIAFLGENQARLKLEHVDLHEPFEAGEPQPKKMKINSD